MPPNTRVEFLRNAAKLARNLFVIRTGVSIYEQDRIDDVLTNEGFTQLHAIESGEENLGQVRIYRKVKSLQRQFISYPKSGRSWIRYALSLLGIHNEITFHHDKFEFNDGSLPAHDFSYETRIQKYAGVDRIVYLSRDPRDVMVSLYHQVTGRFKDFFNYEGTISEFIRDDYFGARNLRAFQDMWRSLAEEIPVLLITYESVTGISPPS